MDRRAVFFLMAALVAGGLIAAVPDDTAHPYVAWIGPVLAIAYAVLAVLSWLDHWGRTRTRRHD